MLLGILLSGCDPKAKSSAAASPLPAAKVEKETVTMATDAPQMSSLGFETARSRAATTARFTGRLTWDDEVTVRVFSPVAGRVREIRPVLGGRVESGDVLATVASPEFGQAQADARKAAADLLFAQRSLARVRELHEHGAIAKKEVEAAEDALAAAESEKERAESRMALYGRTDSAIDQVYSLRAPIAGLVVERNLNPGQEVRSDQMLANAPALCAPLFVITDPARLWLFLDVTELDMGAFKPGLKIKLLTKAYPDRSFEGVIDFVGSSLDPATRSLRLRASVDNREGLLKAEMYVTAEVDMGAPGSVAGGVDIPAKAVFLQDNESNVFVETAPGSFARRVVKVAREVDGKVLAMSGVEAGDRVVTEGCLLLQSMLKARE